MAPMAMAIPPRDMMLAVIPMSRKGMKEMRMATGMVISGMRALGMCQRKSRITRATVTSTSMSVDSQVVDGPQDQVGAVIDGDDLHAGRQPGLDLLDLGLDPLDDVQGVLPVAHDDDPGDHLPLAVQVGDPPRGCPVPGHLPDVLDADRSAGFAGRDGDVLEILDGLDVAPAPDGVLRPAELDEPARRLVVALPHRLHHAVDGDPVGLEPVGVHVHLVLLAEPARPGPPRPRPAPLSDST